MNEKILSNTILRKAQLELLKMLRIVHSICEENQIRYWLSDGTLLGAVRHKGFIPWDDDIDIAMMREDYEKFMEIVQVTLPEPYKVESKEHVIDGLYNWGKILYLDDFVWTHQDRDGIYQGLSIDIFPFDYIQDKEKLTIHEYITHQISKVPYPMFEQGWKGKVRRLIHNFNQIAKLDKKYLKNNNQSDYISYGIDCHFYRFSIFKINDIFPLKKEEFEGFEYYAPNNGHNYLKAIYGDYMKLPAEKEQVYHMYDLRLK